MPRSLISIVVLAVLGLIVLTNSIFTVSETKQAIVLRLGKPQRIVREPGIAFKVPLIENVILLENRILDLDMPQQEVLSTDQLRLVVDAFARFRIVDPLTTYRSVGSEEGAKRRLSGILASRLRDELGRQPFTALLSPERGQVMEVVQSSVNREAKRFGAEIVDVRIKRADLPTGDPLNSAFERMRTARQQEARAIRAQGAKQAEIIRAEADAEAAKIYADSFGQDPEFFAFYRSMQAYRQSLSNRENTSIILSPDSEFLKELEGR
ncbi:protease modulator HflC [Pedomonas mirosovicensis]|uniref:protease modulator HflC n=1 Tax=Pedomonas mirosovicensis TaxID=2908641 RepID=UPI0021686122|nr:protease modulator HflC [Pedomonas mirosovicensis]MCH8684593.1 protease modulator HflC [Pedomonas mirosovicensis]